METTNSMFSLYHNWSKADGFIVTFTVMIFVQLVYDALRGEMWVSLMMTRIIPLEGQAIQF